LIFGVGLIGGAIQQSVFSQYSANTSYFPFLWKQGTQQLDNRRTIRSHIFNLCNNSRGAVIHLHIIWAAGRGGFSAPLAQYSEEKSNFECILEFARELSESGICDNSHFHFFSSAGGLFEGQRCVDQSSKPVPLRPYGIAKLEQEDALTQYPTTLSKWIYRPSSVYGFNNTLNRTGLITALIKNAITHNQSQIYGRPDTLRDYVLADDIGRFVAHRINKGDTVSQISTLSSGKATSMVEILSIIRRTLHCDLYLRYISDGDNASNNTYSPHINPDGWRVTNLEVAIKIIALKIKATMLKL